MYILFFLVAIAPILVRSWSLIDTYDAMSWSGNMRLETVRSNSSDCCISSADTDPGDL